MPSMIAIPVPVPFRRCATIVVNVTAIMDQEAIDNLWIELRDECDGYTEFLVKTFLGPHVSVPVES